MSTTRTKRRGLLAAALIAITGGLAITASSAQADDTGATATKGCAAAPAGGYTIGSIIPCVATFINAGGLPATITDLTEEAPFFNNGNPNNGPFLPLSCSTDGGATSKTVGDTLNPGAGLPNPHDVCATAFQVPVPNNPALCNTFFMDRVEIALLYPNSGLTAGAFATNTVRIVCHPSITVTKTADELSKPTDLANFHITVCNTSPITLTKTSVDDPMLGSVVNAAFGATLAPGACETQDFGRTTLASDPDPLVNTVNATYSNGLTGIFAESTSATASSSTNLFQPSVAVTKSCGPNPNEVGGTETCTIVVTNTSSSDTPVLTNGTISDTLTGDLLAAGNPAVTSSTCTNSLAAGASCSITTARTITASDPNPVVNTVTVHYNPTGFPNDITGSASASVDTVAPVITVTKSADATSKPTDDVAYTVTVCNAGQFDVAPNAVVDTLVGDITANFGPLTPGQCQPYSYTRTVLVSDPDPLVNVVTAVYSNAGGVQANGVASATTNLFQPGVAVTKDCGPDPIQVGQVENCAIVVTNTSSADAPNLVNGTIVDTLSGDLLAAGNPNVVNSNCGVVLPTLGSCTINTGRIVQAGDPSPLINGVTVHYNPEGFPNNIQAQASDAVTVVAPHITVTKVADTLSKATDAVTYTITVCNSGVIPLNRTSVNDTLVGDIAGNFAVTLTPGNCSVYSYQRVVLASDPDPLVNTVTAVYSGVGASATATASATTNLFQPGVHVNKACGPNPIQVGQVETCAINIANTSSADAPNLVNGTIMDTLTGNLLDPSNTAVGSSNCTGTMAPVTICTIVTNRTVLASDPSPLVNTVTVHYNPAGFPNDITSNASAQVNIVSPHITLTLTATPLSKIGSDPADAVTYTLHVCNTSVFPVTFGSETSAVLGTQLTGQFPATLAAGQCADVTVTRNPQAGDPDPLVVSVTINYSGFVVTATATASGSTNLFQPSVGVTKSCGPNPIQQGQAELCTIVVTNTSSADTPVLNRDTITDTLNGNLLLAGNTAVVDNNCGATLAVGASCTIHTTRTVLATDVSPLVNTVSVLYHPAGFPNNISNSASASVVIKVVITNQCTLGFWKQSQHFWAWKGYSPTDSFNTVFGTNVSGLSGGGGSNPTLLQALNSGGGGINDLARHAVAALLNASSLQNPTFTTAQVISLTKAAIAAGPAAITAQAAAFDKEQNADRCSAFINIQPK